MRETSSRSSTSREQLRDLPRDRLARPDLAVVLAAELAHDLQRGPDRRQRVAQLVAQHREEFVLALVGVLGARARLSLGLVQPRVLDRQRGAIRQVLQQRAIVVGEGVVLVVARGGDRAHRPPARLERNREQAVDAKRLDLLGDRRRGPLRHLVAARPTAISTAFPVSNTLPESPSPRRMRSFPATSRRCLCRSGSRSWITATSSHSPSGEARAIEHESPTWARTSAAQGVQDGGDVEARRGEDPRRLRQHAQACRRSALALGEVRAVQGLCALVRDDPQEGDLRRLERVAMPEREPEGADAHVVRYQRNGGPGAADERARRGGQLRVPLDQLLRASATSTASRVRTASVTGKLAVSGKRVHGSEVRAS